MQVGEPTLSLLAALSEEAHWDPRLLTLGSFRCGGHLSCHPSLAVRSVTCHLEERLGGAGGGGKAGSSTSSSALFSFACPRKSSRGLVALNGHVALYDHGVLCCALLYLGVGAGNEGRQGARML